MPHIRVETNLPRSKIPPDFAAKTSAVLAETLGKPVEQCVTTVAPDLIQSWGGKNEPAVQVTVMSIGKLGQEENKRHAAALGKHFEKELGVKTDRGYIHFIDAKSYDVGYLGTSVEELWKSNKIP